MQILRWQLIAKNGIRALPLMATNGKRTSSLMAFNGKKTLWCLLFSDQRERLPFYAIQCHFELETISRISRCRALIW